MPNIPLRDILIIARQESVQMRHHYIGVEHLFLALLQIQGGLLSLILEKNGLSAEYVADTLRRKMERGLSQRLWVGIPYTPRAEIVLDIANDLMLDNGNDEVTERDLLHAIFMEHDSLPIRVFQGMKANLMALKEAVLTLTPSNEAILSNMAITFGDGFDRDATIQREHLFVLRKMFASHASIRIERGLTGFRRGTLIVVVTPIQADNREDAPVVAKIDQKDSILDEVQRYETFVRTILPLQTARLEETPTVPDASELAGVKYSLVANVGDIPQDLRQRTRTHGTTGLGRLLQHELYEQFRKTWWQQKRAYRFQVWKEYDWLLPPILTLDYVPDREPPPNSHHIKIPFNRAKLKTRLKDEIQFGDIVVLENFTVQKVDRQQDLLKLGIGYGTEADKRAYRMDVRGMHLARSSFYRGEVIERIIGRVVKTRNDVLLQAVRDLQPPFDPRNRWVTLGEHRLPNPLLAYEDLLDRHLNGSMSRIHGDLHLGNILIGPNNRIWLIDFGNARDGHTLFDWANLEVSLLGDALMPSMGDEWKTVTEVLDSLSWLNSDLPMPSMNDEVFTAIASITAVREIVHDCLTTKDNWYEYFVALTLCALRAVTWDTMSLGGRRLLFMVAGFALLELNRKYLNTPSHTPPVDEGELTDHLPTPVSGDGGRLSSSRSGSGSKAALPDTAPLNPPPQETPEQALDEDEMLRMLRETEPVPPESTELSKPVDPDEPPPTPKEPIP
jgi:hypothetical protein